MFCLVIQFCLLYLQFTLYQIERTSLQNIIKWADEADEEPGGAHHYRTISYEKVFDNDALRPVLHLLRLPI
jgi:hypothetical protein